VSSHKIFLQPVNHTWDSSRVRFAELHPAGLDEQAESNECCQPIHWMTV
jgi:hypothetical protein